MDTSLWILLLLFGVALIAVSYANKKIDATEETEHPPVQPEDPVKTARTYILLYEDNRNRSVKKCAHCAGENANSARICEICGNYIDS